MKEKVSYKRIWAIAYPIILGSIAQNLINVTDTAFLGRMGAVALGAGALGGLFYYVITTLGYGFGVGIQTMIARRQGEKRFGEIGPILFHGMFFLLPIALLMFLLVKLFGHQTLHAIIQSEDIYQGSLLFLDWRIYGLGFAYFNILMRAFFVGIEKTRVISLSTFFMAGVNVVLDYALIFGHFGLPAMGLEGAALASMIAELSASIYLIVYLKYRVDILSYGMKKIWCFSKALMKKVLKISLPVMAQNFVSLSCWFVFFLLVEKLGEEALAVSNIVRSLYLVFLIPIMGFASASNVLVSNSIGKGNIEDVMGVVFQVMKMCLILIAIIVGACMCVPEYVLRIYTDDWGLIHASVPVMRVVGLSSFALGSGFILFYAVSGTGKTQVSFWIEIATLILYIGSLMIMVGYLNANVTAMWIVEAIYGVGLSILSFFYLKKGSWRLARV